MMRVVNLSHSALKPGIDDDVFYFSGGAGSATLQYKMICGVPQE